jgi:hypothetical protein
MGIQEKDFEGKIILNKNQEDVIIVAMKLPFMG